MEEHRNSSRLRTFKGGTILFDKTGTMDCVVRNLSKTGACLEVTGNAALPASFSLIIKPEIIKRSCDVMWRADNRIGVQFKP